MSGILGPDISSSGLVLAVDAANFKSFKGEPTSNILNSIAETYPTISNTWGTYEVWTAGGHNLYNDATPFTLTIGGVTGNEVTVTGHPFLTYDAIQPQSTGGGLTSGTNYFAKKTGANTFTIHAYDSSQNGSKGYDAYGFAVHNSVNTDTRVSINATSFPTSWWGPPHAPNTQCVKQIINCGAVIEGRTHDCWRIHWFRTDSVEQGGPAYGPMPNIAISTTYTVSFYHRAVDEAAVGKDITFNIYCSDSDHGYANPANPVAEVWNPVSTTEWTRFTKTWTQSGTQSGFCYFYWLIANGAVSFAVDIAEIQLEAKSNATHFTPTSRSTTEASGGGWIDLSPNRYESEFTGNPVYSAANAGSISFDGSTYALYDTIPDSFWNAGSWTVLLWAKVTTVNRGADNIFVGHGTNATDQGLHLTERSAIIYLGLYGDDITSNITLTSGVWYHMGFVYDRTGPLKTIFCNGEYDNSSAAGLYAGTGSNTAIGGNISQGTRLIGNIANVLFYNRAFLTSEVRKVYRATKGRFGL